MSLGTKTALVIGAGGLGGPALLGLAAAGVGRVVLVEDDVVDTSNLARQPLFSELDVGRRKAEVAAERLSSLHPRLSLEVPDGRFDAATAAALVGESDLVLDGSDNFETKFLANDAAVAARRPLVHGGVLRTTAQLLTVVPGGLGGCLRCLFEAPPAAGQIPTCAQAGVLGAVAAFAGALMAAEAARVLAGERGAYEGRLLVWEARTVRARVVLVRRRPGCAGCDPAVRAAALREVTTSRPGGVA